MAQQLTNVWVRVGGDSERMKAGESPCWRYEIKGEGAKHLISTFSVVGGNPTEKNNFPGVDPTAEPPEFFAWLNYYCAKIEIDDTLQAKITLGTPPEPTENFPD